MFLFLVLVVSHVGFLCQKFYFNHTLVGSEKFILSCFYHSTSKFFCIKSFWWVDQKFVFYEMVILISLFDWIFKVRAFFHDNFFIRFMLGDFNTKIWFVFGEKNNFITLYSWFWQVILSIFLICASYLGKKYIKF